MRNSTPRQERCARCGVRAEVCFCAQIPHIVLRSSVIVVRHIKEKMKTTNSARLLPLMTGQAEVRDCGERGAPVDCSDLGRDGRTFLLFPDGSGVEATADWAENLPGPLRLVVPDGNWTQARHITQRVAPLMSLPRVHVRAVGSDPLYTVRRTPHEGGLCTLSAVARVLGVVEGFEVQAAMEGALTSLVTAINHARQRPPSSVNSAVV